MSRNHICKILAISMSFLFIGVSVSSATSNDNLLKTAENIKKLKNLNYENFHILDNIKDLLVKTNTVKIYLILAINFLILYSYFIRENNQEWAQYSFNMFTFCMVMYFIF